MKKKTKEQREKERLEREAEQACPFWPESRQTNEQEHTGRERDTEMDVVDFFMAMRRKGGWNDR